MAVLLQGEGGTSHPDIQLHDRAVRLFAEGIGLHTPAGIGESAFKLSVRSQRLDQPPQRQQVEVGQALSFSCQPRFVVACQQFALVESRCGGEQVDPLCDVVDLLGAGQKRFELVLIRDVPRRREVEVLSVGKQ